jgi:hypothetical protein
MANECLKPDAILVTLQGKVTFAGLPTLRSLNGGISDLLSDL